MLTEKSEIKALVLSVAADFSERANADAFLSALLETDLVSLTDLADAFEALVEENLLTVTVGTDGRKQVEISALGKTIKPELTELLAAGIAEQASRDALRAYQGYTKRVRYVSLTEKAANGDSVLVCRCVQNEKVLAEVRLNFESQDEALLAKQNFEKRPETVINAVKAAVTGNVDFMI